MRRRAESPGSFNVWPAFTDVLGGLVVVLVFLITIFILSEVLITREMTGKDTAIVQLQEIIEHLELIAGESESRANRLERELSNRDARIAALNTALDAARADAQGLSMQLDATRLQLSDTETSLTEREALLAQIRAELAGAEADRLRLEDDQAASEARIADLLASLRRQTVVTAQTQAELETARSASQDTISELQAQAALLGARAERLTAEIERLRNALGVKDERLLGNQVMIETQQARIEDLDAQLKKRLAERVEELEQYASDFFGRMRTLFQDNPNIKVEGDRFVFQSEVLFSSAEATLSEAGKQELQGFVDVYKQLADELPDDLPVIFQVQGHTDKVPIRNARFTSNWDLSYARAQDVVDYLISQGVPAERLAAVAMGEYHPVDPGDSPEAYRRNRRIELKITSR